MLTLRKPSKQDLETLLAAAHELPVTYEPVGCTCSGAPRGFARDEYEVQLGHGSAVFEAACDAIGRWKMFSPDVVIVGDECPLHVGAEVVLGVRCFGVWEYGACRTVYTIDQQGPQQRRGFAYGTLPGHVESGEERFEICWDHADDSVWFRVTAISHPVHPLAWAIYPLARFFQKRFARSMLRTMREVVAREREQENRLTKEAS